MTVSNNCGYAFVHWEGEGEDANQDPVLLNINNTINIVMNTHRKLTAVLIEDPYSFIEDPNQQFGFDNHTNSNYPWKSVAKGEIDVAISTIVPSFCTSHARYNVSNGNIDLTPLYPNASPQTVFIEGLEVGEAESTIKLSLLPYPFAHVAGKMGVAVYNPLSQPVQVMVIHVSGPPAYHQRVSQASLELTLNDTYRQCCVSMDVTILDHDLQVAYDINSDSMLEYYTDAEQQTILSAAMLDQDVDWAMHLVFVVGDIWDSNKQGTWGGFAPYYYEHLFDDMNNYTFVGSNCSADSLNWAIAHELGHNYGDLIDLDTDKTVPPLDPENLMSYAHPSNTYCRLRKDQWDTIRQNHAQ